MAIPPTDNVALYAAAGCGSHQDIFGTAIVGGGEEARNVVFEGDPVTLDAEPLTITMEGTGDVELADALAALTGNIAIGANDTVSLNLCGGVMNYDGTEGSWGIGGGVCSIGSTAIYMSSLPEGDPEDNGQIYTVAGVLNKSAP